MQATEHAVEIDRILFVDPKVTDELTTSRYYRRDIGQTISEARVHHYTGYDNGRTSGRRKRRPSAPSDFEIEVTPLGEDGDVYTAYIVANNVPDEGNVRDGEPVAIAKVALVEDDYIDDTRWYMLISAMSGRLEISPKLICYDGNPEELLTTELYRFDEEE